MISVELEWTICMFFKYHVTFILILFVAAGCGCLRQDQCNIACLRSCSKQKCTGNWPPPPCIVPCDRRGRVIGVRLRRSGEWLVPRDPRHVRPPLLLLGPPRRRHPPGEPRDVHHHQPTLNNSCPYTLFFNISGYIGGNIIMPLYLMSG